jgi:hypothetical protein
MGLIKLAQKDYNIILRFLRLPCAIPPGLYIETALPALFSLLWTYFEPDWRELIHQATGKSVLCRIKGGMEDTQLIPPKETSKATRFYFKATEWADVSTWYLFLAEIVNDSLLQWLSLLIKMSGCDKTYSPWVGSGPFFFGALHDDGTWSTCDFDAQAGSVWYPVWTSQCIRVPPGKSWTLACSMGFHYFDGNPAAVSARIWNRTHNIVLDSYEISQEQADNGHKSHVFFTQRNGTVDYVDIYCQWAYFGPPPPLHEVFGDSGGTGFIFVQP